MNQQNPLAELRDIQLPEAVSTIPAIGWWITTILIIALLTTTIVFLVKRYRRLAYKREALVAINELEAIKDNADITDGIYQVSLLLKRICITRYGREDTAGLTGKRWLLFLDKTGNTNQFTQGIGSVMGEGLYQPKPDVDLHELVTLAKTWIEHQK